jgi:hypothetical protein
MPGTWAEHFDEFITNFEYNKVAIIKSKRLRIPELVIGGILFAIVLLHQLIYKLRFLKEAPVRVEFSAKLLPTYSNWWDCSSYSGSCKRDIPKNPDFCSKKYKMEVWNPQLKKTEVRDSKMDCRSFDFDRDVELSSDWVMASTRTVTVHEVKDEENGEWKLVPGDMQQHLMNGVSQMLAFRGLTGPSEYIDRPLAEIQGFIKFANESTPRRIQCADEHKFLEDCPNFQGGSYWSKSYPAVSGSDPTPEVRHDATGCFVVAGFVRCHMSTLLAAAGVDLDKEVKKGETPRVAGFTLDVNVHLTNWDSGDFWSFPYGLKPKYIIEVKRRDLVNKLWIRQSYQYYHGGSRERTDHYGIRLLFGTTVTWGCVDLLTLGASAVIAASFFAYASQFVTSVLLKVYDMIGHKEVSTLFKYNVEVFGSSDKDAAQHMGDPVAFEAAQEHARTSELRKLLVKDGEPHRD